MNCFSLIDFVRFVLLTRDQDTAQYSGLSHFKQRGVMPGEIHKITYLK